MKSKSILTGAFVVAALGFAALGASIWDSVSSRAGFADATKETLATIAMQTERIDRLQAAGAASDAEIARLHRKLDLLLANAGGAALVESTDVGRDSAVSPNVTKDERVPPEMPLDAQEAPTVEWVDPVADAYDREWTQSDWGQSAVDAIEAAIPKSPFFSRYGGDFVTDCKMTTCRVEWLLPNTDQMSAREREELLSMARYEMLALAAANATDVGQLTTEWALDGSAPRIATTFKRSDASE